VLKRRQLDLAITYPASKWPDGVSYRSAVYAMLHLIQVVVLVAVVDVANGLVEDATSPGMADAAGVEDASCCATVEVAGAVTSVAVRSGAVETGTSLEVVLASSAGVVVASIGSSEILRGTPEGEHLFFCD
jgi:hypothetical protein